MTKALLAHEIDGGLVDNYVLTHSHKLINKEPIRIERYVDHKIPYGVVLAKNSSRLEKCLRKFLFDHPQEVFEIIASNLVPLKVTSEAVPHFSKDMLFTCREVRIRRNFTRGFEYGNQD